jgi:hypothetical protein
MMKKNQTPRQRTFADRFNIVTDIEEARWHFLNRVHNEIIQEFLSTNPFNPYFQGATSFNKQISKTIANHLGVQDLYMKHRSALIGTLATLYIEDDFTNCLNVIEGIYDGISRSGELNTQYVIIRLQEELTNIILEIISMNEVDLQIYWENGLFYPTGAKLMDEALVNELLEWLKKPEYASILTPFQKGLRHYSESIKRPELLSDVITDIYEALEALAKIVTDRPTKELSANAEKFIEKMNLNHYYKSILKEYIAYSNEFRHAADQGKKKPDLSQREVEAFIYFTGIFIRLAIVKEPAHSLLIDVANKQSSK